MRERYSEGSDTCSKVPLGDYDVGGTNLVLYYGATSPLSEHTLMLIPFVLLSIIGLRPEAYWAAKYVLPALISIQTR